jgi:RNA polymerase sigma-70 factor (ECF subfamily)
MTNRQVAPEEGPALVDACRALVLRQRMRANAAADAEDVTQDACARALGLSEPTGVRDPVRYLLRIARNLFIDLKRGNKRDAVLFQALGEVELKAGDAFDPERILAGKQELGHILAAIDALPPRCREAFTLHRFHGLSYTRIARRMGVSNGTVEKHVAEAMRRIAQARAPREKGR